MADKVETHVRSRALWSRALWLLAAVLTAILGAAWAAPTTSKGAYVWLGVVLCAAPVVAIRGAEYEKWTAWAAVVLAVFAVFGTLFGYIVLLPAAAILGAQSVRSRFPVLIATFSVVVMVGTAVGVGVAIYGHGTSGAHIYVVAMAPGTDRNGVRQQVERVSTVVSVVSEDNDVKVEFRSGASAGEISNAVAELLTIPGVSAVTPCTGSSC